MAGVKKSGAGGRPGRTRPAVAKKGRRRASAAPTIEKSTKNGGKPKKRPTRPGRKSVERTIVRVRALDPFRKCGPGTSVERLIRVDELVDRRVEAHLVFLDRHGWYCEHGRTCHAVGHARKHRG